MEKKFINAQECAEYLHVTTQTISNWAREFKIPFYKPHGKLLFIKDEIDQWVMASKGVKNG